MRSRVIAAGVSQSATVAGNMMLSVLVAKTASVEQFGSFGVAYAIFVFILGCSRALSGEVLLVSGRIGKTDERQSDGIVVPILLAGFALMLMAIVCGVYRGISDASTCLFAAGVLVVAEDYGRYWANSLGLSARAAAADALSLFAQLVTYLFVYYAGNRSAWVFVVAWGVCALPGIIILSGAGYWNLHAYSVRRLLAWVVSNGRLGGSFLGDFILLNLSGVLAQVLLASVHGAGAVAGIRGSQLLFGPISIAIAGLSLFALPELSRAGVSPRRRARVLAYVSAAMFLLTALWTACLLSIPSNLGVAVTGASWVEIQPVLYAAGLYVAAGGLATGAVWGIRSLREGGSLLKVRLVVAPAIAIAACWGAVVGSGLGLLIGVGVSTLVSSAVWWLIFVRLNRQAGVVAL